MVFSSEGFYLAVTTDDLEVKSVNTWYMQVDWEGKAHDKPITCVAFTDDTRFMMSLCEDMSYKFIPNIRAPGIMRSVF